MKLTFRQWVLVCTAVERAASSIYTSGSEAAEYREIDGLLLKMFEEAYKDDPDFGEPSYSDLASQAGGETADTETIGKYA